MSRHAHTRPVLLVAAMLLGACFSKPGSLSENEAPISGSAPPLLGNPEIQAIAYSGHRHVVRSVEDTPTVEETKEDLRILAAMGVKLLRTYNTTIFPHSKRTLQAIQALKQEDPSFEMYVMLGAWIQCVGAYTDSVDHQAEDTAFNQREIAAAIELAHEYPAIVNVLAVGNEARVSWQGHYVPNAAILKWVTHLRDARDRGDIPSQTMITTSDNWATFGGEEQYRDKDLEELLRRIDFISLHTYAFHDTYYNPAFQWAPLPEETDLPIAEQIAHAVHRAVDLQKSQVDAVQKYLDSIGVKRAIHIGETGWASLDNSFYGPAGTRAAHEYTAGLFYAAVREWTRASQMTCFYFEAFDEPWKSGGTDGSEGHFGLFTVDGQAKFALWDRVDAGAFAGLSRGGHPIVKTHGGNEAALLETLVTPVHRKFEP